MSTTVTVRQTWSTYFLATRPAFLTVTLLACWLGFAVAAYEHQPVQLWTGVLATVLALCGHAGANLINDYYDSVSGCDAANLDRIYPFTGGSRFIQDGVLTALQIRRLAQNLFLAMIGGGLVLCVVCSWRLVGVGGLGVILGWGYSASPLKLMARGLWGELAIAASWALVVIGAAMIGGPTISIGVLAVGVAYGMQAANILFVNQIPDRAADKGANKMTLAVKAHPKNLWVWSAGLAFGGYGVLGAAVLAGAMPVTALLALTLCVPLSAAASYQLYRQKFDRRSLERTIKLTIATCHIFGLVVLWALVFAAK